MDREWIHWRFLSYLVHYNGGQYMHKEEPANRWRYKKQIVLRCSTFFNSVLCCASKIWIQVNSKVRLTLFPGLGKLVKPLFSLSLAYRTLQLKIPIWNNVAIQFQNQEYEKRHHEIAFDMDIIGISKLGSNVVTFYFNLQTLYWTYVGASTSDWQVICKLIIPIRPHDWVHTIWLSFYRSLCIFFLFFDMNQIFLEHLHPIQIKEVYRYILSSLHDQLDLKHSLLLNFIYLPFHSNPIFHINSVLWLCIHRCPSPSPTPLSIPTERKRNKGVKTQNGSMTRNRMDREGEDISSIPFLLIQNNRLQLWIRVA